MPDFHRENYQDTMRLLKGVSIFTAFAIAGGVGAVSAECTFDWFQSYEQSLVENSYEEMPAIRDEANVTVQLFIPKEEEEDYSDYEFANGFIQTAESAPVSSAKYATLFSDEYYDLNNKLLEYANQYGSFDTHGVHVDGLAVLAQANCESFYMCDISESISALYPSKWLTFDEESDIAECCAAYVWAFGGLDDSNSRAWSGGGGVYEQGPLQQRVPASVYTSLDGSVSEKDTIVWSGLYDTIMEKCPQVLSYCTGTNSIEGANATGDRYRIKDNCIIWRVSKEQQLDLLWDRYYSQQDYTPTEYELLAISAYSHWVPGVISGDCDYTYFGFNYDKAWFDIAKGLGSEEGMAYIRDYVHADIDANRALYYEEGKDKDAVIAALQPVLFNTRDASGYTEAQRIYKDLVANGVIPDGAMDNPEYPHNHAQCYAIQYLYAYTMLEELLVNRY